MLFTKEYLDKLSESLIPKIRVEADRYRAGQGKEPFSDYQIRVLTFRYIMSVVSNSRGFLDAPWTPEEQFEVTPQLPRRIDMESVRRSAFFF